MYAQSFLTTCVRGSGELPTTSAKAELGVSGFMKAAFGFLLLPAFLVAAFLVVFAFLEAFLVAFFFLVAICLSPPNRNWLFVLSQKHFGSFTFDDTETRPLVQRKIRLKRLFLHFSDGKSVFSLEKDYFTLVERAFLRVEAARMSPGRSTID